MSEKQKILLVEDDRNWRELIEEVLEKEGYTIVTAERCDEAIARIQKEKFHLVISDLRLEEKLGGIAVLEHVKNQTPYTPVIILTAYSYIDIAKDAIKKGAFDYLPKGAESTSNDMLRQVVEDALNRGQQEEKKHFEEIISNRFPSFLSDLYDQVKSEPDAEERCRLQITLFDSLLKFITIIIICEYLQGDKREEIPDSYLQPTKLFSGKPEEWHLMCLKIYNAIGEFDAYPFMNRFYDFFIGKHRDLMIAFIKIDNRFHISDFSEPDYMDLGKKCGDILMPLLRELEFLAQYKLCRFSHLQILKNKYHYKLIECTGGNQKFRPSTQSFNILFNCEEILFFSPHNEVPLPLHPFVILDTDGHEVTEVFFFNGYKEGEINYKSYGDDREFTTHKYTTDLLERLSPAGRKDE